MNNPRVLQAQGVQPRELWDPAQYQTDEQDNRPIQNYNFDQMNLDVLRFYSEEDVVPKKIRKKLWAFGLRGLTNGFLDQKDMGMIDSFYHLIRLDYMESQPSHRITMEHLADMDQAYLTTIIAAKRAIGVKGDIINERTMQNTQIIQKLDQLSNKSDAKPGWIKRIFG